MRFGLFLTLSLMAVGCAVQPVTQANGYNVQLFFEGAPLGDPMVVGDPTLITVKRIEQRADRCTNAGPECDPTATTPIVLVSASCDDGVCSVEPVASDTSAVSLRAVGMRNGATTLHVRVRSTVDGAEWDDGYPLSFRPQGAFAQQDTPMKIVHDDKH